MRTRDFRPRRPPDPSSTGASRADLPGPQAPIRKASLSGMLRRPRRPAPRWAGRRRAGAKLLNPRCAWSEAARRQRTAATEVDPVAGKVAQPAGGPLCRWAFTRTVLVARFVANAALHTHAAEPRAADDERHRCRRVVRGPGTVAIRLVDVATSRSGGLCWLSGRTAWSLWTYFCWSAFPTAARYVVSGSQWPASAVGYVGPVAYRGLPRYASSSRAIWPRAAGGMGSAVAIACRSGTACSRDENVRSSSTACAPRLSGGGRAPARRPAAKVVRMWGQVRSRRANTRG